MPTTIDPPQANDRRRFGHVSHSPSPRLLFMKREYLMRRNRFVFLKFVDVLNDETSETWRKLVKTFTSKELLKLNIFARSADRHYLPPGQIRPTITLHYSLSSVLCHRASKRAQDQFLRDEHLTRAFLIARKQIIDDFFADAVAD